MKASFGRFLVSAGLAACAAGDLSALLARKRLEQGLGGGKGDGDSGFSLMLPDPSALVWDNIVEEEANQTISLHGWLKVPVSHEADRTPEDQPRHACLRVSAHSRSARPSHGPLLAHCGGPGEGRFCALDVMQSMPELVSDFAWLGIDQRGISLSPDCSANDCSPDGHDCCGSSLPVECPFTEESADPVLPFPSAQCDEIYARLANLTYEQQVSQVRAMMSEFTSSEAPAVSKEDMDIIFAILRSGGTPADDVYGLGYRNERIVRWYYRLVQLEHNLCVSSPRFSLKSPSGRTYKTFAFMGTRELARDIDLFRAAIGASKISLVGYSYGTVVAPAYATLFPQRVGRLVIDAAVPPEADLLTFLPFYSQGIDSVVNGVLGDCALSVYQSFPEEHRCPLAPGPSTKLMDMITDDSRPDQASTAFTLIAVASVEIAIAPLAVDCLARLYRDGELDVGCSFLVAFARSLKRDGRRHAGFGPASDVSISSGEQTPAQAASAGGICQVGDHVQCPGTEDMCAGNQCCPRIAATGHKTFPCPSATNDFFGRCEVDAKEVDCVGGGAEPVLPSPSGDRFGLTMIAAVLGLDFAGRLSEEAAISWWKESLRASPLGTARGILAAVGLGSWPVYSKPLPPAGSATTPALIVGNLHDAQTDYIGAQQLRARYPAGALMTWQGYGHVLPPVSLVPAANATQRANDQALRRCVGLVSHYLASGELPEDGHICPLAAALSLGPAALAGAWRALLR